MSDVLILIKQQFAALCAQRDAVLSASAPLRFQRDAFAQAAAVELAAVVDPLNEQIATIETGLPDLMNQIAVIAQALDGKTAL